MDEGKILRELMWRVRHQVPAGGLGQGETSQLKTQFGVLKLGCKPLHVQPYLLKQYNHRWFLIGHGSGRPGISNYALDRIEAVTPDPTTAYAAPPASLAARFRDVVGVSVPAGAAAPEVVRLRFGPGRSEYVRTKPLHPSQEIGVTTVVGLEISLRVHLNRELETLLLSFGDDVEVLAPSPLRQQLAARLRQGAAQYAATPPVA